MKSPLLRQPPRHIRRATVGNLKISRNASRIPTSSTAADATTASSIAIATEAAIAVRAEADSLITTIGRPAAP